MDVVHQDLLLLVLVILAARFGGEIATRVGAPAVMGELVAGVVLGPSLLGLVAPVELIRVLAEIGVVFLLFRAGLETDGHRLLAAGPKAIVVALGGFAAGLALSRRSYVSQLFPNPVNGPFARRVQQETRPLIQLFSPIFFVLVGLSLDLQAVAWGSGFIWVFSLSLGAVAVLGKFVGAVLLRAPWPQRVLIGMAMVPWAEVALIFAQMGQSAGLLDPPVYAGLIMVIAYSTLLSPFWVRRFRDLCRRTGRAHHLA